MTVLTRAHPRFQPPTRPNEHELSERVGRFLADRLPDAGDLEVEAAGATVVLRGRVTSPRMKQLCVECSQRVAGVFHIVDQLTVANPMDGPGNRL